MYNNPWISLAFRFEDSPFLGLSGHGPNSAKSKTNSVGPPPPSVEGLQTLHWPKAFRRAEMPRPVDKRDHAKDAHPPGVEQTSFDILELAKVYLQFVAGIRDLNPILVQNKGT